MPGANGSGGARPGAGAKPGNKNALKRRGLTEYADEMVALAEKWIRSKSKKDQMWAFEKLLPYVFAKQPQEVQGNISHTVSFTRLVVEEVNVIHQGQEN